MALVHPNSCPCGKSELELFKVPVTQTAIESSSFVPYRPVSTLGEGAPIEFFITGSGDDYIDLSETYMEVTARVIKKTGGDLVMVGADGEAGADAGVGPVNNWLHSLFSQIDVDLNGVLVSSSTNTYAYRAYLENLLSYGGEAKRSQLSSELWYKDIASHMDHDKGTNTGLADRQKFIWNSKKVSMVGRPHLDLCFQDRLILNGVDVKMRFVRSKDEFSLMGDAKVEIVDMTLYVRKVKLNPSVQLEHIKRLEKDTAKYPVKRVETKVFSIPQGNKTYNQENLFLGQRPTRIVLGMVRNTAFSGDATKNPFNFDHFNANFVALYVDGMQVPSKPYKPNLPGYIQVQNTSANK